MVKKRMSKWRKVLCGVGKAALCIVGVAVAYAAIGMVLSMMQHVGELGALGLRAEVLPVDVPPASYRLEV